ncbi:MAG: DUF1835 domain-containing protein [Polyangiaceae bacterium]|nr:DUF1835 domain-containing protein [Polyangiaceae bacterium]
MTIHIATSDELGRLVRRALREPVLFISDNLLVGPSRADARAHVETRPIYWALKGREQAHFLRTSNAIVSALESRERVVIWTRSDWHNMITTWAFCAWSMQVENNPPHVELIHVDAPGSKNEHAAVGQVCASTPVDIRKARTSARPLSTTRIGTLARSWRRFTASTPILGRRGRQLSEPLIGIGIYQALFFPRLTSEKVKLSLFDELLFNCVRRGSVSALDVFMSQGPAGVQLREWVQLTGDVFLARRLDRWAQCGALVAEPYQPDNVMKMARYKLSDMGVALLQRGLSKWGGASLWVGGAEAYRSSRQWVVIPSSNGELPQLVLANG